MAFMSAYPQWSWISIIINGLIIYGLAVHGDEVDVLSEGLLSGRR